MLGITLFQTLKKLVVIVCVIFNKQCDLRYQHLRVPSLKCSQGVAWKEKDLDFSSWNLLHDKHQVLRSLFSKYG